MPPQPQDLTGPEQTRERRSERRMSGRAQRKIAEKRETFDRNKVMAGLLRACEKRPVPSTKLDSIVNAIEKYVQESPERERPTSKIGEMIMRRLKELDKVAYVRFASVYLEFEDVSEFMTELKHLVRTRNTGPAGRK